MTGTAALYNTGQELLDLPDADPALVRRNLDDIIRANRWLGGHRALASALHDLLGDVAPGTRLTLLDVGTGAGDLPAYCRTWGARRGVRIHPTGLERIPAAARVARNGGLPTALASAEAFPIADDAVDVVLLSQVVHHFSPDAAVEVLRACDRIARRGVIVVDLIRSATAKVAYRLAARLMGFAEVTLVDGLTSIDRGLTVASAMQLLHRAGLEGRVRRIAPYRVTMTWRRRGRTDVA